jgi:hypothetical protein
MKPIYLKPDQSLLFVAPKDPKINGWGDKMYIENPPYRPGEECYVREALHKGINISSSEYCSIHYPDDTDCQLLLCLNGLPAVTSASCRVSR